jgi:hypothetical protein
MNIHLAKKVKRQTVDTSALLQGFRHRVEPVLSIFTKLSFNIKKSKAYWHNFLPEDGNCEALKAISL